MNEPTMNELQDHGASDESRRRQRDSLFLKADIRLPEQNRQIEARIRNLSAGGLMAEAPVTATLGEAVEVELRNIGWVLGSVAWIADSRFGVAFETPIDPKLARKPVGNNNSAISLTLRPNFTSPFPKRSI